MEKPVAIIGLGALGSLVAASFARAGVPVTGVSRWQEHNLAIAAGGLLLREGGTESRIQFPVFSELPADGQYSLVIVVVKSFDTEAVAKSLAGRIDARTPVLTMQNGLGNAEALAAHLSPEQIVAGTTTFGALRERPGMVHMTGRGGCEIGAWRPAAERYLPQIKELFRRADIECQLTSPVVAALWKKLAVNAVINPLTAILRVRNGELLEREGLGQIFGTVVEEVWRVAARHQIALPTPPELQEEVRRICRATAANRSSMLCDVEQGRRTEIDAINGAVGMRGRERGILTAVNDALTGLVRALTAASCGSQRGRGGESA
ncbi:MAG: 2-dehydropantoate 2-reductase [Acidobacteria bacterium]|nr:2-dehydropantoate 2-reductase [Acidobacteriota bacterium]